MKRIPLLTLQKALYQVLINYQTTPVFDDVPDDIEIKLPYITLGAFTCRTNGTKINDIADVSLQIHIWSEYQGKKEVNEIANDIICVLGNVKLVLEDDFKILSQDITMFESFEEEETGYHGVITLDCRIENLK